MTFLNPHLHVLAADGAFLPGGRFVELPRVPERLLVAGFRRAVLDFLVENEALSEESRGRMLRWRYSGFSVHNEVSVAADDAEGERSSPATCCALLSQVGRNAPTATKLVRNIDAKRSLT